MPPALRKPFEYHSQHGTVVGGVVGGIVGGIVVPGMGSVIGDAFTTS